MDKVTCLIAIKVVQHGQTVEVTCLILLAIATVKLYIDDLLDSGYHRYGHAVV